MFTPRCFVTLTTRRVSPPDHVEAMAHESLKKGACIVILEGVGGGAAIPLYGQGGTARRAVSYTHLRAHETEADR
eukprot:559214-Amphidinium_carterae.1